MGDEYIKWLSELNKNSSGIAGGKGANLGEMYNAKMPIPQAFVVTTNAYNYYIEKTNIKNKINQILESIDIDNIDELNERAKQIRELVINAEMPEEIKISIEEAYEHLSTNKESLQLAKGDALSILKKSQEPIFVAVRSSATTEDLADASFAGQQETYINIKGNHNLIKAVKHVFASLFTSRAIYYRKKRGFSNEKFSLATIVQKMINSDKSGVMFSKNPIKKNNTVLIEAVFGLGEGIVSGKINPDSYELSKDLKLISKKIGNKKIAIIRTGDGETKEVMLNDEKSKSQVLTDSELFSLTDLAIKIENHYKKPQDIEFAIENREIFITQSRPITTESKESKEKIKGVEILSGLGASPGVASGKVIIITGMENLAKVKKGDVLVTKMTNPDMVVSMQKASAIITNEGGVTSHAAIVSREMGIPAVVGTGNATEILKDNDEVTVDGSNGKIYKGKTQEDKKVEIFPIIKTNTKVKLIVDIPEASKRAALTKCDSIGLLRLEGIIASAKKHPLQYEKENKLGEYIKLLEENIEKIISPFKEAWIRTSDLRSDEFANLEGSPEIEGNPMLGMHGIRFSLKHPNIFEAELEAIKNISKKNPNKIIGIMFPQIILSDEIKMAKLHLEKVGLSNLKNIKIGIMVETPAAVFIIRYLLKMGIDFVSLGTNDLTQYTLAIDRNNSEVQELFNENNYAVLNAIRKVLISCQEMNVESSICGQAGTKKEIIAFLIQNGIDSISVNADAAHEVSKYIAELENKNNNFNKNQPLKKVVKIKEAKETPEQKTKKVIEKIEGEIVKEIVKNPKPMFDPGVIEDDSPEDSEGFILAIPNKNTENPENEKNTKKPDTPAYVSNVFENNEINNEQLSIIKALFENNEINNEQLSAIKALFGDSIKMPEKIEEKKEELDENGEEDDEEVLDIF